LVVWLLPANSASQRVMVASGQGFAAVLRGVDIAVAAAQVAAGQDMKKKVCGVF